MLCRGISVRKNSNGTDSETPGRPEDPAGNFAAVRDQ
jgi:hypothetical protein